MKIYSSVKELIGSTPLYSCERFANENGCSARLLAKLEFMNPAGSTKDRAALSMIEDALMSGRLAKGGAVIEPTSGNTGIAICALAASLGCRAVIVMPDNVSKERFALVKAYGGELVLTPGELGMKGAIAKANELCASNEGSIIAGQFENPANPTAHYRSTAPELWADSEGQIDLFVACVGTGGTFSGISRYLKEKDPAIVTVAVEPEASPLISRGLSAPHKIQGIGANFVPENFDRSLADEVITVTDAEAYEAGRAFARSEGLLVGISSGATLAAALKIAKRPENAEKTVAFVLPDSGERYLSTDYILGQ